MEKLLGRLCRCCNRLMERTVWAVRNVTSGTCVSNRAERPSKTTPKSGRSSTSMDDDQVEKALAVIRQNRRLTVREIAEEVGICKSSCHQILTEERKMRRVAAKWRVSPYPWIFDEEWDDCCPPAAPLSRFGPCGLFLVPEVEILTKRSPISDGRGDRRKFDTGPSRRPAKHIQGHFPEMEKTLEAVYEEWRGVLWRRQVWLSCK